MTQDSSKAPRTFAIIFILGSPGAGKGTLCNDLAQKYNLTHFSVGDNLRTYMRANRGSELANHIQDKLDNQGFLTSQELNPFLDQAFQDALGKGPSVKGILVDGFPRCLEQLEAFEAWPFQADLPLRGHRPDAVLLFSVTRENARERYLTRGRDSNDSEEKFENRFEEYQKESPPVEEAYRKAGLLIDIDANGSKEKNIKELTRRLEESDLWHKVMN